MVDKCPGGTPCKGLDASLFYRTKKEGGKK